MAAPSSDAALTATMTTPSTFLPPEHAMPKVEVTLMFDWGGVITSAAVPAARRLGEIHMQLAFEAAGRAGVSFTVDGVASATQSPPVLAQKYAAIYFLVGQFTQRIKGSASAWTKLETGAIRRNAFIDAFHQEALVMLQALHHRTTMEELQALGLRRAAEVPEWRQKYPHLTRDGIKEAVLHVLDAESFLSVLEKLSPRKNVLNLLHFLRVKSYQEIKIGLITNSWETEGHYTRTSSSIRNSGTPTFVTASCPVEYGSHTLAGFDVNGLFDVIVQSYMIGKAKPSPDIYETAVEAVVGRDRNRMSQGEQESSGTHLNSHATKPMVFFFDDLKLNCDAAARLPSKHFTKVYHIANGAPDVYKGVLDAIRHAGVRDPFWKSMAEQLESEIAPLFNPTTTITSTSPSQRMTWVQAEFHNIHGNLIFLPPPPNTTLEPLDDVKGANFMDQEERNRILHHLARVSPQHFPFAPVAAAKFEESGNLLADGSFATSSGKVIFEMFRGGMSNPTYRFTCRTGSYVIRKQPRGRILPGAHNVKRESALITHLANCSKVPVPKVIAVCDDRSVCEQDFYVMRYRDGRMIYRIEELALPPFTRPFSQSRVLARTTLNPRLFFKAAVKLLVDLHAAPIPAWMLPGGSSNKAADGKKALGAVSRVSAVAHRGGKHPVLHTVDVWDKQYQRAVASVAALGPSSAGNSNPSPESVKSAAFEYLTDALRLTFTHAAADPTTRIPVPEKLCLTHGDFKVDNIMFSHRSMEGRAKYPPKVLLLLDFELTAVGDPLTDVAYLSLFHFFPSPKGIASLSTQHRENYPTPDEILDYYCQQSGGYLGDLNASQRSRLLRIYMAAMCHKLAGIAHGVIIRGVLGNASDAEGAMRLRGSVDLLSRIGCDLLQVKCPPAAPGASKL